MNKAELADKITEKVEGITRKQATDILEAFTEIVTNTIKAGEEVTLAGFGSFMSKHRSSRAGVNPQNPNEKIQIPAVTVPKFKAGKALKDALKTPKQQAPKEESIAEPTIETAAPEKTETSTE